MVAEPVLAAGLDHVRVERALHEVVRVVEAGGLLLEHPDELGADDLALGLGVGDAGEPREEALLGVHGDERHLEVVAERGHHLVALVLAHQAVIDEHAGELVADGLVGEQRGHRGVDAAGQPADHPAVAHLLADPRHLLLDHRGGAPGHVAAGDVAQEGLQDLGAVGGVRHLGVELDPVEAARRVLHGRHGRLGGGGERGEARRGLEDGVAMAHPAALLGREALEQPPGLRDGELGAPELADLGALHAAAQREHHRLHAVTDAEHRDPELEQPLAHGRRAVGVDRCRPAGEDQGLRRAARDLLDRHVVRQQLGEHPALAHAAGDQL